MTTAYFDALAALEQAALLARADARDTGHSTIPLTIVYAAIREARYIAQGETHAAALEAGVVDRMATALEQLLLAYEECNGTEHYAYQDAAAALAEGRS